MSLLGKGNVIKKRKGDKNSPACDKEDEAFNRSDSYASVLSCISCWIVLEALSPQTYKKPESLANDDVSKLTWLDAPLPWENITDSEPGNEVFY